MSIIPPYIPPVIEVWPVELPSIMATSNEGFEEGDESILI